MNKQPHFVRETFSFNMSIARRVMKRGVVKLIATHSVIGNLLTAIIQKQMPRNPKLPLTIFNSRLFLWKRPEVFLR
nr:hypothetical protein [Candidatus Midichloria mitochondrii]